MLSFGSLVMASQMASASYHTSSHLCMLLLHVHVLKKGYHGHFHI